MDEQTFDIGKWHAKLITTPRTFSHLMMLVQTPEAASAYKESIVFAEFYGDGEVPSFDTDEILARVRENFLSGRPIRRRTLRIADGCYRRNEHREHLP